MVFSVEAVGSSEEYSIILYFVCVKFVNITIFLFIQYILLV